MTAEVVNLADFRPVHAAADLPGDLWARIDADEATVAAFAKDRLPPAWTVDFDYETAEWTATVLHREEPAEWPAFSVFHYNGGAGFVSVWPCGSRVGCILDSLETALGLISSGVFEAAAGRYGAMDEPSDALN